MFDPAVLDHRRDVGFRDEFDRQLLVVVERSRGDGARVLDPMGRWILDERSAFVSQLIYGTFGRYALSQLKKLSQVDPKDFHVIHEIPVPFDRAHGLDFDGPDIWCMFSTDPK